MNKVELKSSALIFYLNTRKGQCTEISFIDTMGIAIYHNKREEKYSVELLTAERSKIDC